MKFISFILLCLLISASVALSQDSNGCLSNVVRLDRIKSNVIDQPALILDSNILVSLIKKTESGPPRVSGFLRKYRDQLHYFITPQVRREIHRFQFEVNFISSTKNEFGIDKKKFKLLIRKLAKTGVGIKNGRYNTPIYKRMGDARIVAEALLAQTNLDIPNILVTADKGIFEPLFDQYYIKQNNLFGSKLKATDFPQGFTVQIFGRKLHVIPSIKSKIELPLFLKELIEED